MRIALVSQEYPPETAKGGIGTQTYLRAHGLAAYGHEVWVISHSKDDDAHTYQDGDVQVMRIPGFDHQMPIYTEPARWLTYSVKVASAVSALHSQKPLNLVVFPEWGGEGYIHLLNQTEWNLIPTIVHIHGPLVMFAGTMGWPEVDSEFYRVGTMMEGTCLRLANAVSSSSKCSADWCARHYGVDRSLVPILHTGVDVELFRPRKVPKAERPTIIFVGGIVRNKGVHNLVEAGCRLAETIPDLRLRILGRGDEGFIEELRRKAIAAGHQQLLDFPGFVAREELSLELSSAHVFAGPSKYEGGPGNVYLEAMACGLPVVACGGSGASESVRHGETGILVTPDDMDALAEALRSLLSDPSAGQAMGNRGRRFVMAEAESKACLKRIEAYYIRVASEAREPKRQAGAGVLQPGRS